MASDYAGMQGMATSRDTPNPLRPYYVAPSIGTSYDRLNSTGGSPPSGLGLGKSARDLFSDLDYSSPLLDRDGPGVSEWARKIADQALWKYTSVLLAQPFDVAKTILQVRMAEEADYGPESAVKPPRHIRLDEFRHGSDSDSDAESPSYFTPTKPARQRINGSPSRRRGSRERGTPRQTSPMKAPQPHAAHQLRIRQPDSILEVLGALWSQSGATGLWKATNATFIYNVLTRALESWTRGMLSALANVPDPTQLVGGPAEAVASAMGAVAVADSPSPLTSLAVAVAAAAITGLVLAPLDMVRTRLIITPTSIPPRSTLQGLRSLPSLIVPSSLLPITLLHSTLPTLLTSSAPLLLRANLRIDQITTPTLWSIASFCSSAAELFLKLPLETLLRRAQVSALQSQHASSATSKSRIAAASDEFRTVVVPGPYKGVFGTVYSIVYAEGHRRPKHVPEPASTTPSATATPVRRTPAPLSTEKRKRGQGLSGLCRGWRVGVWGLCGVWLAAAMNSQNQGGEF